MKKSIAAASLFTALAGFSLSVPVNAEILNCVEEATVVQNEILGASPGDLKEKAWQKHGTALGASNPELCHTALHEVRVLLVDGQGRSE